MLFSIAAASAVAKHFDTGIRGRAQWLVQTSEFRAWLREDASSVLLVDGCMDAELISPLSGFCCGLISNILNDPDSAVAFFFAGLHAGKALSGPVAIMRSLITQLLAQFEPTEARPGVRV